MNNASRQLILAAAVAVGAAGCATQQPAPAEQPAAPAPAPAQVEQDDAAAKARAAAAAENQRLLSEARGLLDQARGYTGLNADQSARLREAEAAMAAGDGRRAYDILNGLLSELKAARMTYSVVRGDSLWRIAGKSEVYGNAYQWPLIYKANADKIRDADLIQPGQELAVDKAPLAADVEAAVRHAKTRGSWSVGAVEESDKAYLNGN
jgi:nucleoid-associated protein YgaU